MASKWLAISKNPAKPSWLSEPTDMNETGTRYQRYTEYPDSIRYHLNTLFQNAETAELTVSMLALPGPRVFWPSSIASRANVVVGFKSGCKAIRKSYK
jgi:hypothetical protein